MAVERETESVVALRAARRQVANRLLVVVAVALVVQVAAWALLGDVAAAGVVIVAGYAALLLLGAAWLPMPPAGFSWRSRPDSSADPSAGLDRLFAVMVVGGVLNMQVVLVWLNEQDVPLPARFGIVLAPSILMCAVVEVRRRTRLARASQAEVAEHSTPSGRGE